MIVWKPINLSRDILCWPYGQTFIFCCKSLTVKFDVEISFHNLLSRLSLLFLWWTRGILYEKHTNMWYHNVRETCGITMQVVSQTIGPNLYDLHCRHVTLPHLQDGIANSKKAYFKFLEGSSFRSVCNPLRLKFLRTPYRKKAWYWPLALLWVLFC